jgi:release factor glutamine methyltransferase
VNEAELVLTRVLNCNRLFLYLNKDLRLTKHKSAQISKILKRRINGEPLHYILKTMEFMGFKFKVDQRALIPRPETEILVEAAIKELKAMSKPFPKILDLGTGSGCIAVSIAKLFSRAEVWATDVSAEALQLASANARLNRVKIKFLRSDLFCGFKNKKFDLIISNPPYISSAELSGLAKELSFEPQQALVAGLEGLDFYRRIINQVAVYLNPYGLIALELGAHQALAVKAMLIKENFGDLKIIKDYNNIDRVVIGKKRIV